MLAKNNRMQLLLMLLIPVTPPLGILAVCDENTEPWQDNRDGHQPTDLTGNQETLIYLAETLADDQVMNLREMVQFFGKMLQMM